MMMKNVTYSVLMMLLLTSCGFQSRKYTKGYHGKDHEVWHKTETSKSPVEGPSSALIKNDDLTTDRNPNTIEYTEKTPLITGEISEINTSPPTAAAPLLRDGECTSDTLKLGLGLTQEEKMAMQPPHEFHPLIKKRRWDYLILGISSLFSYIAGLEAFGHTSGLTTSLGVAIVLVLASMISIWYTFRSLRNIFSMRKLMKGRSREDRDSLWYSHLKFNNIISVIFSPALLILLFLTGIFLIIGLASFYEILFIS
jgi:hypothetical protein